MNLFRNLVLWLLLAVLGALLAQHLLQDPGYVLVRYRGVDYSTTLAMGIALLLALVAATALLWTLLRLPFRLWHRHRRQRARARLLDGLAAFERGEYAQAEQCLREAADHHDASGVARTLAARAAFARGDDDAGRALLDEIAEHHPALRALALAERAHALQQPDAALAALEAPRAQPLPPRGLLLRARALAASGRGSEAYGLLGALRQQRALPAGELDAMQAQWAALALREAGDANALADHWDALPAALRTEPAVVAAYAGRAAALRWDEAATRSIEQALDARWDDDLAALYGQLDVARLDHRRAQVERWLPAHPSNSSLLLAGARIAQQQDRWLPAEDALHRAITLGIGAPAWEALGDGAAHLGDEARARRYYANALRSLRGEPLPDAPERATAQAIVDSAAIEERDEHGLPRLRG